MSTDDFDKIAERKFPRPRRTEVGVCFGRSPQTIENIIVERDDAIARADAAEARVKQLEELARTSEQFGAVLDMCAAFQTRIDAAYALLRDWLTQAGELHADDCTAEMGGAVHQCDCGIPALAKRTREMVEGHQSNKENQT